MGGSKQTSGPTQSGKVLQGSLVGGILGPEAGDLLVGTQGEGAAVGGPVIQGHFGNLNDVANSGGFFGSGVASDPDNPFNTAFSSINEGLLNGSNIEAGVASGASATAGQIEQPDAIISEGQTQLAIDKLLNPNSVFDTMSGGPIVDIINAKSDAASAAFTEKAMQDLSTATEIALADFTAGGGFISSSAVGEQSSRLARDVMNDVALFEATLSLENTKYLGDLAMQDIVNQTNAATVVLTQAMVQRGQDVQSAIAQAQFITQASIASAQNATQASIATANNQTSANIAGAQLGQQGALGLLGLGLNDSQFQQGLQFEAANKPLDLAAGLAVGSNVSKGNSKTL